MLPSIYQNMPIIFCSDGQRFIPAQPKTRLCSEKIVCSVSNRTKTLLKNKVLVHGVSKTGLVPNFHTSRRRGELQIYAAALSPFLPLSLFTPLTFCKQSYPINFPLLLPFIHSIHKTQENNPINQNKPDRVNYEDFGKESSAPGRDRLLGGGGDRGEQRSPGAGHDKGVKLARPTPMSRVLGKIPLKCLWGSRNPPLGRIT